MHGGQSRPGQPLPEQFRLPPPGIGEPGLVGRRLAVAGDVEVAGGGHDGVLLAAGRAARGGASGGAGGGDRVDRGDAGAHEAVPHAPVPGRPGAELRAPSFGLRAPSPGLRAVFTPGRSR